MISAAFVAPPGYHGDNLSGSQMVPPPAQALAARDRAAALNVP
jgi:hypothetical protein